MNRCTRCAGLVVAGYDAEYHSEYWYCLNCGHRPTQAVREAPVPARLRAVPPGMCLACLVRPVAQVWIADKSRLAKRQPKRCAPCRAAYGTGAPEVAA